MLGVLKSDGKPSHSKGIAGQASLHAAQAFQPVRKSFSGELLVPLSACSAFAPTSLMTFLIHLTF